MKSGADALARLAKLQAQLQRLKQARVAALERERAGLSDELSAVFEALTPGQPAYGAQARLGARHALAVEKTIATLASERDAALGAARAHGMRARLAEQAADAAERRRRDQQERKDLADLVERAIGRTIANPE